MSKGRGYHKMKGSEICWRNDESGARSPTGSNGSLRLGRISPRRWSLSGDLVWRLIVSYVNIRKWWSILGIGNSMCKDSEVRENMVSSQI